MYSSLLPELGTNTFQRKVEDQINIRGNCLSYNLWKLNNQPSPGATSLQPPVRLGGLLGRISLRHA